MNAASMSSVSVYLYKDSEYKPVYFYKASKINPVWLFSESEDGELAVDFIVWVPATHSFNGNQRRALLNAWKLPACSIN
jgi:hypothetical protein